MLAPDVFWWVVTPVDRYVPDNLTTDSEYDWVVLKTDEMPQIPRSFLETVVARMAPVFANEAFVVWTADPKRSPGTGLAADLASFWARLSHLGTEPAEANRYVSDAALADAPRIRRHADISDAELRAAMDDLFRRTGYLYPTRRDQAYWSDMRRHVAEFLDHYGRGTVLELCAGGDRFAELPDGTSLVRTELSEVGLELARSADASRPRVVHAVMDAQRIAFPDETFDAVLFTDSIEHVRDASLVLREAGRVLVVDGKLLVTFANLNSVNQVLSEKLGYPRFVTNHQHIREFTLDEIHDLLDDAGLEILDTAGIFLYPYWGVPGIDDVVRKIIDDDPEFVEMMRELGRRAGAEYAYTGVVVARRRSSP